MSTLTGFDPFAAIIVPKSPCGPAGPLVTG